VGFSRGDDPAILDSHKIRPINPLRDMECASDTTSSVTNSYMFFFLDVPTECNGEH